MSSGLDISAAYYTEVLRRLPDRLGRGLKQSWLERNAGYVGRDVIVARGVRILGVNRMHLDDGCSVARDVVMDARAGLRLGAGSLIGFESVLLSWTHRWDDVDRPAQDQGMTGAAISVGARAWLGARVIVLPGVDIGEGCVVGAGSVVTGSLPAGAVAAGVPARVLRHRD